MLKIDAQALLRTQRLIGQFAAIGDSDAEWVHQRIDYFDQSLASLKNELNKLNLIVSMKKLESLQFLISSGKSGSPSALASLLKTGIAELRERIEDEIETRHLISISPKATEFIVGRRTIVSPRVVDALPDAITDLHEAANCIGLSRYTAAVFHLMRAMEVAVVSIGVKIGATVMDKNGQPITWGKIIANIKNKIDTMPVGDEKDDWHSIHALLYAVKEAWRNNTMHPKQAYTEDEAIEVFDSVRSFIRRLAEKIG